MGLQWVGHDWATELNCGYYNTRRIPFIWNEHGKSDGSFFYLFFQSVSSMLSVLEEKQRCIETVHLNFLLMTNMLDFKLNFNTTPNSGLQTWWYILKKKFFLVPRLYSTPSFCTTMGHLKCLCMGEEVSVGHSLSKGINSCILYILSPYIPSQTYKWHK